MSNTPQDPTRRTPAMGKAMLVYGVVAGGIIITSMILSLSVSTSDDSMQFLEWVGYLIMIVALSLIFVGIKRYRDQELGGVIKFGTAAKLGIGITLVASLIYVAAWEVNLSLTDYAFIDVYTASIIAEKQAEGVQGDELQATVDAMEDLKVQYGNPAYRLPMTFLEIFPVGLLMSLLAAALLRNSRFMPATA